MQEGQKQRAEPLPTARGWLPHETAQECSPGDLESPAVLPGHLQPLHLPDEWGHLTMCQGSSRNASVQHRRKCQQHHAGTCRELSSPRSAPRMLSPGSELTSRIKQVTVTQCCISYAIPQAPSRQKMLWSHFQGFIIQHFHSQCLLIASSGILARIGREQRSTA